MKINTVYCAIRKICKVFVALSAVLLCCVGSAGATTPVDIDSSETGDSAVLLTTVGTNNVDFTSNGTLKADGTNSDTLTGTITLDGDGTIDSNGQTFTLSGAITDSGSNHVLHITDSSDGGGSVVLGATNSFASGDSIAVDSGELDVATTEQLTGVDHISLADSTVLKLRHCKIITCYFCGAI